MDRVALTSNQRQQIQEWIDNDRNGNGLFLEFAVLPPFAYLSDYERGRPDGQGMRIDRRRFERRRFECRGTSTIIYAAVESSTGEVVATSVRGWR